MTDVHGGAPSPEALFLWGKTGEKSRVKKVSPEDWHPLLAHLIDAANVAGELWDHYLSSHQRKRFAGPLPAEDARTLYRWLTGLHDLGKATPGFQASSHRHRVHAADHLGYPAPNSGFARHELLSAHLVLGFLLDEGWDEEPAEWVANVLAGHHGTFPAPGSVYATHPAALIGNAEWRKAQRELFDAVSRHCGVHPARFSDHVPDIGSQIAMSGAIVLADWIASDETLFEYVNDSYEHTRYLSSSARQAKEFRRPLRLDRLWRPSPALDAAELYRSRFGIVTPRGTQRVLHDFAADPALDRPGLFVVEAPTGEGKTEAALAAAEVLAARFGCNGLFFGLPTQATTDQIFTRVLHRWGKAQTPRPTFGLAHGKARRNPKYRDMLQPIRQDEDGTGAAAASPWLQQRRLPLLAPIAIATIDQLLFAGVSARYVMLRHLALAGKVVIIDEVHAYDAYMSRILHRVLAWLGLHEVPVILLSATLPSEQRTRLLTAYSGAATVERLDAGHPQMTWVPAPTPSSASTPGEPPVLIPRVRAATPSNRREITVEFLRENRDDHGPVVSLVKERTRAGGCVLILRNTVKRAQATFEQLQKDFDAEELTLVHARFTADDRARLDGKLTRLFGPPTTDGAATTVVENPDRPVRHVVVATQVAEQSLDIDFDLVISDLAPIDLLLQRAGRLHRHRRPRPRPEGLAKPVLVVSGFSGGTEAEPPVPVSGDGYPYHHHLLLRSLAVLREQATRAVTVPDDVPRLIEDVYGHHRLGPATWEKAMEHAEGEARAALDLMETRAGSVLLAMPDPGRPSLDELQQHGADRPADEEEQAGRAIRVRDGAPSIEVILLRRVDEVTAETVSDSGEAPIRISLDRVPEDQEALLGQAIRLREDSLPDSRVLTTPKSWSAPWCKGLKVLLLEGQSIKIGKKTCSYDTRTGWKEN